MLQKLIFIGAHYGVLAVVVAASWGFGRSLLRLIGEPVRRDKWLEAAMSTAVGIGTFICIFQGLGIAGILKPAGVFGTVAAGLALAAWQWPAWIRMVRQAPAAAAVTRGEWVALLIVGLVGLPTLFAPLAPPNAYDELMYHLPYAREVARSGSLGIFDWLRYPWFPYNFNILYAASLLAYDDVFTHLQLALAGWLSVLMVYRLGLMHVDRICACLAAAIWLSRGYYAAAYIDVAVALFVLAACVALWWWRDAVAQGQAHAWRWLLPAAFFLGLSAGSKYQALVYMPLACGFVILRERRPAVWLGVALAFLLPCGYWYLRNAVTTGDPFNPLGGGVFGFTNWNAADLKGQIEDVHSHAAMPDVLFWPAVLVPLATAAWRGSPAVRAAFVFCVYAVITWAITSRFPRYLTSAFPMLALMAAIGWRQLYAWLVEPLRARVVPRLAGKGLVVVRAATGLLLILCVGASVQQSLRNIHKISPTAESREAFLRGEIPGYDMLQRLRANPQGKLYQVALNEGTYYGPVPVWGDYFGPWRYSDYILLAPEEAARKLSKEGFGTVIIQTTTIVGLETRPDFDKHFALIEEGKGVKAYRILNNSP